MNEFIELYKRGGGNQAVTINKPYNVDIHLTQDGSSWFWAAFCIYTALAIVLLIFMFRKPANERLFYYTGFAPVAFMAINYFTLASNLGWIPVKAKYKHATTASLHGHLGTRQVFYSRYIGWFMAFPWPIIQVSLLGNTPLWQIAFNVALTETYVVIMLFGAVVHTTYKWGYFVLAITAGVVACISVMTTTRNLVRNKSSNVMLCFKIYFSIVMILWCGYPLSFALSEGGNVMQPDSEGVFYGILDVFLLGLLPTLFVPVAYNIGFERLGLNKTINHYGEEAAPAELVASKPAAPLPKAPPSAPKGAEGAKKGPGVKQPGKKTKKVKRVKKIKRPVQRPSSDEEPVVEKASDPVEEASPEEASPENTGEY